MITWSKRANLRRQQYVRHIADASQDWFTAWRWEDEVFAAVEHPADFPESGRESPEFTDKRPKVRDLTIGNYRLFYRIKKNNVEIISLRNCRQNITSLRSL